MDLNCFPALLLEELGGSEADDQFDIPAEFGGPSRNSATTTVGTPSLRKSGISYEVSSEEDRYYEQAVAEADPGPAALAPARSDSAGSEGLDQAASPKDATPGKERANSSSQSGLLRCIRSLFPLNEH